VVGIVDIPWEGVPRGDYALTVSLEKSLTWLEHLLHDGLMHIASFQGGTAMADGFCTAARHASRQESACHAV
jgi:hypothetical protein